MSVATRYPKSLWSYNPIPYGCIFYSPLWNPACHGTVFKSPDPYGRICTRTGGVMSGDGFVADGDDYITLPLIMTSNMWSQQADFTVVFVAKATTFSTTAQTILGVGQATDAWSYARITFRTITYTGARNRLELLVRDNTNRENDRWITDNDTNLVNDTKYHCAVTCISGTLAFYINGSSVGIANDLVGDVTGTLNNTKTLIGAASNLPNGGETFGTYLTGATRELSVYNRGLSAVEVAYIYNATKGRY